MVGTHGIDFTATIKKSPNLFFLELDWIFNAKKPFEHNFVITISY